MKCDTPMTFEEANAGFGIFDRQPIPITNEEWFCFLTTEEKAKFIFKQHFDIYQNENSLWNLMVASAKGVPRADQVDAMIKAVEEWLKKPHEVK